jgi:hypothetical protein
MICDGKSRKMAPITEEDGLHNLRLPIYFSTQLRHANRRLF